MGFNAFVIVMVELVLLSRLIFLNTKRLQRLALCMRARDDLNSRYLHRFYSNLNNYNKNWENLFTYVAVWIARIWTTTTNKRKMRLRRKLGKIHQVKT